MRDSTGWLGMTISGATTLLLVTGATACSGDDGPGPPHIEDSDPVFDGVAGGLLELSDVCTVAGSTVTLTLPDTGATAVIQTSSAGELLINTIADCGGAHVTASSVTHFRIIGSAMGDDTVILDYAHGLFMDGRAGASAVIDIALGDGGDDSLRIRGTGNGNDFALGQVGVVTSVMTGADANADVNATGAETVVISAGDGDDSVSAAGDGAAGSPIELPIDYAITLYGGAGTDTLAGGSAADTFYGGAGVDTVDYSAKRAPVIASLDGTSNDGVAGEADELVEIENLTGSATASNTLTGDSAANMLIGGDAADTLDGGGGDDWVAGGDGSDSLSGGDGADTLAGEAGDDSLHGGADNDSLDGGAGDDLLTGDAGDDMLTGGAGADSLASGEGDDVIDATDDDGDTPVDGGGGNDICIVDLQDVNVVDCELQ